MRHPLNVLTEMIVGAAIDVHREIGPGMLESAYEACLAFELLRRNLNIERQKPLPLCHVGLLVNFNVAWLSREGIKRIVHDFPA